MPTLPDLDPGGKRALKKLQDMFAAPTYDSFDEISRDDLIWYIRTLIVNYECLNEEYTNLERKVNLTLPTK